MNRNRKTLGEAWDDYRRSVLWQFPLNPVQTEMLRGAFYCGAATALNTEQPKSALQAELQLYAAQLAMDVTHNH